MSGHIVVRSITVPESRPLMHSGTLYHYGTQPIERPDSATVLAHAFGDVTGALLDFKAEILKAQTASAANDIATLIHELLAKVIEMEDLALRTADQLNTTKGAA